VELDLTHCLSCIKYKTALLCAERQHKVEELQSTFGVIKSKAEKRQSDLEQTLAVAEKFWDNLNGTMVTLKELQDTVASTDTPALEPDVIREQQDVLEVFLVHASSNFLSRLYVIDFIENIRHTAIKQRKR